MTNNGTHRVLAHLSVSLGTQSLTDSPLRCPCDPCCEGALIGDCRLATEWELSYTPHEGLSAVSVSRSCLSCGVSATKGALNEEEATARWGKEMVARLVAWLEHAYWYAGWEIDSHKVPEEYRVEPPNLDIPARMGAHRWKPTPGELAEMALRAVLA